MDTNHPVLVVCSDERRLADLCHELDADGYAAQAARTAAEAQVKARNRPPLVLVIGPLERPLAQLELARAIRTGTRETRGIDPQAGLIALGQSERELELVRFLEVADDYLDACAGYVELRARLGALARRLTGGFRQMHHIGALEIDAQAKVAAYDGQRLELSRTELALLTYLAGDPTRAVPEAELLREVWGYRAQGRTRTVSSHVSRLRRKLAQAGGGGELVVCVRGVGYRLCDPAPGARTDQTAHLRAA